MRHDFVIFGIYRFGNHGGIVVVVEDAVPHDVCGGVNVLDHEAAAATSGFDLGLIWVEMDGWMDGCIRCILIDFGACYCRELRIVHPSR